jgi:hypothetical protein
LQQFGELRVVEIVHNLSDKESTCVSNRLRLVVIVLLELDPIFERANPNALALGKHYG